MTFYIFKALQRGLVPVARITVGSPILLETSEVTVQKVLEGVLSRPVQVSEWKGDDLVKREPRDAEERAVAGLKRFLTRPYFASRDVPEGFVPRYTSTVEVAHAG